MLDLTEQTSISNAVGCMFSVYVPNGRNIEQGISVHFVLAGSFLSYGFPE